MTVLLRTFSLCLLLLSSTSYAADTTHSQDPYENYNRHAYMLNDTLDRVILKPIAKAYNYLLPKPVTTGINNFFNNLAEIPTVINDVLQGQLHHAVADTWRLAINSTVGVLGFFDVAVKTGLPPHYEDTGLTFAKWGYTSSNYLVLPILGPSTVRDALSFVPNEAFSIYPYLDSSISYPLTGLNLINKRAQLLNFENVIEQAALDPYAFQRNAYLQRRNFLINTNNGNQTDTYVAE